MIVSYSLDNKTRSLKGVCLARKKFTMNRLASVKDVKGIYNFFYKDINGHDVSNVRRNKKSDFLKETINKKYRKLYSETI